MFSTGGFMPGTGVGLIFRILPTWMEPLLFHLFFTLWGSVAKRLEYARSTFMSTADLLMQARAVPCWPPPDCAPARLPAWLPGLAAKIMHPSPACAICPA